MRARWPIILWTYLGADLWRLVALTAAVLVGVIAFAAAIKPLADGKLDPGQALKFMLLAIPPMLQFALPFAAGFGATLAHHRFASDNEARAAMAGGVSHRALLMPALVTGILLSMGLYGLSNSVIPRFLRSMELLLVRDVGRLLTNSIESGASVRLPDGALLHADQIDELGPDAASGASNVLVMQGVVAFKPTATGAPEWEATARRAGVWLFTGETARETSVRISLRDAVVVRAGQGPAESGTVGFRFSIAGGFSDDPKFYTSAAMGELRRHPERVGSIDVRRRELITLLERGRIENEIRGSIRATNALALEDADGQRVSIRASALEPLVEGRWRLVPPSNSASVPLVWRLGSDRTRLQSAAQAWIGLDETPVSSDDSRPRLFLELLDVGTTDPGAEGGETRRSRQTVGPLYLAGETGAPLLKLSVDDLVRVAEQEASQREDPEITRRIEALRERLADLDREILSKRQERFAASAACLVMLLAGAVAGLRLADSRPLLVYAWSFFPSVVALITIEAGQSMTHRSGEHGLILMWAGVGILGLFTLTEFLRLRRR